MGSRGCGVAAETSMLPWSTGGMSARSTTGSSEVSMLFDDEGFAHCWHKQDAQHVSTNCRVPIARG